MEDALGGERKMKKTRTKGGYSLTEISFVHESTGEWFSLFVPFLTWVWTEIMKIC